MEKKGKEKMNRQSNQFSRDKTNSQSNNLELLKSSETSDRNQKSEDSIFVAGDGDVNDDQPLGWDAGTDRVQEAGWGELPPASVNTNDRSDTGVANWSRSLSQEMNKQSTEQSNSQRSKGGRKGSGRRAKFTDVTDQLGFNTLRASTWAQSGNQHSRNSPVAGNFTQRNVGPPSHSTSHSRIYSRNTPIGSTNMSPGVLGQTASPQQQNFHSGGYSYAGQTYTRPQNMYCSYQQSNSSCNGFGSSSVLSNSILRSRGTTNNTVRNNNNSPQADAPLSSTNVYIRGLDASTTDDDLRKKCEKYGAILSTKAIMDKTTGQCKGYGFVDFESADAALLAVEGLNREGKIQAQMAKVSAVQQEQDPTNLYFANLPPEFTEEDLEKTLDSYGDVISTRILKDQDGVSRGVGFARMDSKELCDRIIKEMNGKTLVNGSTQPLLVKFADSGKKVKTRSHPVGGAYSSVPPIELSHFYTNHQYEQLNGSYIRNTHGIPYVIPAPSQYVVNAHYPHVISGYPDPQMGGLASQLHNLSLHGTNTAVSQQPTDVNGGAGNGAVTGGQSAGGSTVQPMAMHPSYTYPIYGYPMQYGMQGGEPNLTAMTLMQSATPPAAYMPSSDMLIHPEIPSNAPALYTNQPPPNLQAQPPTGITPSK